MYFIHHKRSPTTRNKLSVEITWNKNPDEIFESKLGGADANARADQAKFVLTKTPELIFTMVNQTEGHRLAFEMQFMQQPAYRLWNGYSWNTVEKQVPSGISEIEIQFPPTLRQYQWLRLSLQPINSVKHDSVYNTYDKESVLSKAKSIEIKGMLTSRSNDAITFDFEKEEDVLELYQNYLAKEHAFGNSCLRPIDYKDSTILNEVVEKADSINTAMPLFIDLR